MTGANMTTANFSFEEYYSASLPPELLGQATPEEPDPEPEPETPEAHTPEEPDPVPDPEPAPAPQRAARKRRLEHVG